MLPVDHIPPFESCSNFPQIIFQTSLFLSSEVNFNKMEEFYSISYLAQTFNIKILSDIVSYPIRWSLLFIFWFLYGSSPSKQQRNIVQLCTNVNNDTDDGDNHTDDVPNDDYVVVVDQAPHLGSATLQTRGKMMTMTVDNILSGGT